MRRTDKTAPLMDQFQGQAFRTYIISFQRFGEREKTLFKFGVLSIEQIAFRKSRI